MVSLVRDTRLIWVNSFFLFVMLLAFKHTYLIPYYDVFLWIILHLLSFYPPIVFFGQLVRQTPCPISLNTLLYPSHWQPPLTVPPQKKRQPLSSKMQSISRVHFFFPHKAVPQIYESHFILLVLT